MGSLPHKTSWNPRTVPMLTVTKTLKTISFLPIQDLMSTSKIKSTTHIKWLWSIIQREMRVNTIFHCMMMPTVHTTMTSDLLMPLVKPWLEEETSISKMLKKSWSSWPYNSGKLASQMILLLWLAKSETYSLLKQPEKQVILSYQMENIKIQRHHSWSLDKEVSVSTTLMNRFSTVVITRVLLFHNSSKRMNRLVITSKQESYFLAWLTRFLKHTMWMRLDFWSNQFLLWIVIFALKDSEIR